MLNSSSTWTNTCIRWATVAGWQSLVISYYWYQCHCPVPNYEKVKVAQSWLFVTPWTIQFMEFSRPEYWSGWPIPSPGDLPNLGIKPRSPVLCVDFLTAEPSDKSNNARVGGIFLTRELNQRFLHRRWFFTCWVIREAPHLYEEYYLMWL